MKTDGTDAKDIAIHFLERTTERFTPSLVAKTIVQTKTILQSGYTKDEIINTIDYLIDVKDVNMYSIGYVSSAINNVLDEMNRDKNRDIINQQIKEFEKENIDNKRGEVDIESKNRNKRKVDRFGNKPREREEPYSDLFK